jgi:hypothetical protein
MGAQLSSRDQFRDWRLDVDNMSYEVSSLSSNVFYFLFLNCRWLTKTSIGATVRLLPYDMEITGSNYGNSLFYLLGLGYVCIYGPGLSVVELQRSKAS